ncbi:outer membrane lipoprotein-sorting protein [Methylomonas methanica]|uniref:Uncharacterized protein TP-0789 domain-containing protein n=1 Tax=Methylomonas methanica (strain DSM 25384 / MC09) TaxID=857087 RepID=G0A3X4_METMM|nr:outer membrane lipoprotein-sorting protein [Methylomonas methanica]AEG02746.1 hypothetical protein Metme_4399 [Methylomonas methanica MC09]
MKSFLTASLFVLFSIVQCVSAQESSATLPDSETQAPNKQWTGREILDEVSLRHDRPYEFELKKMSLIDKSGNREERMLKRFEREMSEEETRFLTVFTEPAGIKGVSLLTWQKKSAADDQWLYLPAYGRNMKRISKGGKKNYFMGTDYTFEDLASDSKDNYAYERLEDQVINGENYYVVKSVPTDPDTKQESGYSYRLFWIKQANFFITQVEFYDKREQLIKRQTNSDLEQIKDQMWRANTSTMEHIANQHQTITHVESRSFAEDDVQEKFFQERSVVSGLLTR